MTADKPTVPSKCLKCKADLTSPIVCEGCRTLYPVPRSADYFDLLRLEHRYDLDEGKLTSAFRSITRNIHPDRVSGQPEEVRDLATRLSAEINEAYTVLKDPLRRAAYMLELAGGPSGAQAREVPGNLLVEVMRFREEIEEARAEGDDETLGRIRSALRSRRRETLKHLALRADDLVTANVNEKMEFRELLNSIKYFDNLLAELATDPLKSGGGESDE